MNILVTLDRNYLAPLEVLLGSLFLNNAEEHFDIYLISDDMTDRDLQRLEADCRRHGSVLHPVAVREEWFSDAPIIRYYSRAMYYRLLAAQILPDTLDRVLYLDPDILAIGRIRPLYETPFTDELYAAAMHEGLTGVSGQVSRLRLPHYENDRYYNSGVLLMNLQKLREDSDPAQIFQYAQKYKAALLLPDQDILNALYGHRILPIDESLWNYDVRQYEKYRIASQGEKNMDWVMEHTVFLHFCGKNKPWTPDYSGRFSALYKHYRQLIKRI